MDIFERWFEQDLTKKVGIQHAESLAFSGNNASNVVGVYVYKDGAPAELTGTVTGTVIRPDGMTVPLTGTLSGNAVSAVLTEACFAVPGYIGVALTVTSGDITMTVLKATFEVEPIETGTVVDPSGEITANVAELISGIEAAVATIPPSYSDLLAAVAPTFDPEASTPYQSGAYVWYDGKLYQFTANHTGAWTGTDAVSVNVGEEISELKSAINYLAYGNIMAFARWSQGGYADLGEDPPISVNTGSTRIRTCVSVTAKEKVTMECLSGFQYCYSVYVDNIRKDYKASWTAGSSTKEWEYGAGTYTIYISFAKSNNTAIVPDEATDGLKMLADDGMSDIPGEIRATQESVVAMNEAMNEAFPGNPMFTLQWLIGGYSDLSENPPVNFNTENTRARLKVSVDVKSKLTVLCANGYKYVYSVYKGDMRQTYKSASWSTDAEKDFEYGEGIYTLYMSCANSSNSAITADEAKSAITILADNAVLNIYDAIGVVDALKETKNLYDPGASNTLRGYYNASNTWVTSYDFGQTDYIPVKQGVQYISALLETPVLWFDENKDFLSSTASSGYKWWVTPPTGAYYVKFLIQISEHTSFYVYSNEPDSVQVPLDMIPYGLYNQYAGKKAVAFGTSLTYRAKSTGGYLEYLPEMAQMNVDNQGLGNSTILEHQEHTDMMGMITGYTGYADKDVVLLEGFVNDWYDNSDKLGTWKDEGVITSTTVCGRIRYAINYILTQNPHTTLIMILDPYGQAYNGNPGCASTVVKSGYTQMEYYDEIAKLAASLGIPTIKGYAISGMNELVSDYYIDIIHPSSLGAKQFANVIWENMKNIPIKMQSL